MELAQRYHDYPNLWGIELLNEPTVDRFGLRLVRFYRRAYRAVTAVARPGTRIVFSDGYAPLLTTNTFWLMTKREFPAVMDVHCYQVFGAHNKSRTFKQHLRRLIWTKRFLRLVRLQQPTIVGEWSAMLPIKTTSVETSLYITAQHQAFEPAEAQFSGTTKLNPRPLELPRPSRKRTDTINSNERNF